jgi:hypothetical protein
VGAFQAGRAGSIPVARSAFFQFTGDFLLFVRLPVVECRLLASGGVRSDVFAAQIMSLA